MRLRWRLSIFLCFTIAGGGAYVLAKALEVLDKPIFDIGNISGHTLKHLTASLTAFCIVKMLKERTAVTSVPRNHEDS